MFNLICLSQNYAKIQKPPDYATLTYSGIKGEFLSYHAYMVLEVKDPLSR